MTGSRTYGVAELAATVGCSETHIRDLVRTGVLPTVPHMGRRVLIPRAQADEIFGLDATPAPSVRVGAISVSGGGSFS